MSGPLTEVVLIGEPMNGFSYDRVFFPFGSRRWDYDCVSCRSQCCRGYGYGARAEELEVQLHSRPALGFFVRKDSAASGGHERPTIRNCAPSCFWLGSGGHCELQRTKGYSAKPETCRLFPFNVIRRLGRHLIVSPHLTLCPLTLLNSGAASDRSDHVKLFAEMGTAVITAPVRPVAGDVTPLDIAQEREIVDCSERYLGMSGFRYEAFAAAQVAVAQRHRVEHNPSIGSTERLGECLHRLIGGWSAPEAEEDPGLVRMLVAITPILRSQILFTPAGVRALRIATERLPFLMMALHKVSAIARAAGMDQVTYQTVQRLFAEHQALLWLLAHSNLVMVWRQDVAIDPPTDGSAEEQTLFLKAARALRIRSQRTAKVELGELLLHLTPGDRQERLASLRYLASRLYGRLARLDGTDNTRMLTRRSLRSAVHHFCLQKLSDAKLALLGTRRGVLRPHP